MKKLVYGVLGLLVVVMAIVIALPFLVPAEKIKDELIIAVNDATGRTLAIDGDFGISVFPVLGVNASKVSFSNSAGSENPNMATMEKLTIELDLLPLLTGQVKVDTFILHQPAVYLEVDKEGGKNWEFSKGTAEGSTSETGSASPGEASDLGVNDLNLGNVKIVEGAFTYIDQPTKTKHEVSDVNLAVILNGLDQPFKTQGTATWKGEILEINTELGALRAVLENKATPLNAAIKSSKINITYDGSLNSVTPLSLQGETELNVASVKDLSTWIGQPLDARENTFGALAINGTMNIEDTTYAFKNASLAFDKIKGKGDFEVNLGGKIPYLEGKLDLAALDINPYLPEETQGKPDQKKLKKSKAGKWDNTPIDFSGLKSANAKFDLSVASILIKKIKIGQSTVKADLKNGVMKIALKELSLYGGNGKGVITVNARGKKAKISNAFTLADIQLKPLLTDAADFEKVEGTGLINFKVKTVGNSQRSMVKALSGKGNILFENGAISGVNLAAMSRNITSAFTGNGDAQKTDFAELSGTFTIKKGVLRNKDLKMLNPFVRLSGRGKVSLPPKTLNYRVEPKLVANTKGQGGKDDSGLVVPVKISGSWDKPKFAPDLAGMVTKMADPKELKKKVEEAGKGELDKILKGGTKDGIKGLLGTIK